MNDHAPASSARAGGPTPGPLELDNVETPEGLLAARNQLQAHLEGQCSVLVISCARWSRAGIGGLQLLLAAEAALALRGRTMRLAGVNESVRTNFEQAGMRGWFLESPCGQGGHPG